MIVSQVLNNLEGAKVKVIKETDNLHHDVDIYTETLQTNSSRYTQVIGNGSSNSA